MSTPWPPDRVDRWLTIEQPVTYWSFWAALLRLIPLLAVPFVVVVFAVDEQFALLPFVFVAATLGYAVRAFDSVGALFSVVVAGVYSFLLWLDDVGKTLLIQPTPMLSVLAVLAFVAVVAGFASPTLHGQQGGREFEQAREEWRQG